MTLTNHRNTRGGSEHDHHQPTRKPDHASQTEHIQQVKQFHFLQPMIAAIWGSFVRIQSTVLIDFTD